MNGGFSNPITGLNGVLIRKQIQSQNFQQGVSGWIIRQDGTAEFNGATFRGNVVIQSDQAVLFYSGIPANGNLIGSVSPIGGTDTFGNVYPSGIQLRSIAAFAANWQLQSNVSGGLSPMMFFDTGSGHSAGVFFPLGQMYAIDEGNHDRLVINGPTTSVDTAKSSWLINIDGAPTTTDGAFVTFHFNTNTPSGPFDAAQIDKTGFNIRAGSVTATDPASAQPPASPETWHNASLGANFAPLGGVFGTPRYQKEGINGGRVKLSGAVTLLGAQAQGTAMFNMPVGYRPLSEHRFITANSLNGGAGSQTESVNVGTNGNVSIGHSGVNGNYVFLDDITFELD